MSGSLDEGGSLAAFAATARCMNYWRKKHPVSTIVEYVAQMYLSHNHTFIVIRREDMVFSGFDPWTVILQGWVEKKTKSNLQKQC